MILNFTLDGYVPPSNNQLLRKHWAIRSRELKGVAMMIIAAIAETGSAVPPDGWTADRPMRMIVRCYRKRQLDTDNAFGGLKQLVDAVKRLRLIHDDSPAWLDLWCDQRIDLKNPRTEIELKPMPGTARSKSKMEVT